MASYHLFSVPIGPTIGSSTSTAVTQNLNAAATWLAYSFQAQNLTLNSARAFLSATTGSMVAADVTCSLYSDSGGSPNASVDGPFSCATAPSGSAWYNWTGFTTALTSGTVYWLVFKNANGTPAANFPTFRVVAPIGGFTLAGSNTSVGNSKKVSTDSGSTWAGTSNSSIAGFRLGFSDGSYYGMPFSQVGVTVSGVGVYSSRELGSQITTPANATLRVSGLYMVANAKTGTPTGTARLRLYTGSSPSLLATTASIPAAAQLGSAGLIQADFTSVQTISPGTVVTITLGETTQSDASTNRFNVNNFTVDSDSNSLAIMPFGSFVQAYFDGSTWTLTNTAFITCGLVLDDTGGEFAASSAYGPVILPTVMV